MPRIHPFIEQIDRLALAGAGQSGEALVSIEDGVSATLGLAVGDRLAYNIAGQLLRVRVASLRKVQWDSFRVNFYVLAPPSVLESHPATYITSLYLPAARSPVMDDLVRQFPNLLVIDVAAILSQVQAMMDQVARAVEFVFVFSLAAGLLVLWAAIAVTHDQRVYDAAVMRTLGAAPGEIMKIFIIQGALIGVIGTLVGVLGGVLLLTGVKLMFQKEGEVDPVGAKRPVKVDVRIVSATNKDLAKLVADGRFREDLYYRLNVFPIKAPPLRERREDIPILVQRFIAQANRANQKSVRGVEADAMRRLSEHAWPGNIRELKNLVETLVVLTPGPRITRDLVDAHLADRAPSGGSPLLPVALGRSREEAEREMLYASILAMHRDVREVLQLLRQDGAPGSTGGSPFEGLREVPAVAAHVPPPLSLEHMERGAVKEALNRAGGNRRRAAEFLGISERTLYRKIKEYGLA